MNRTESEVLLTKNAMRNLRAKVKQLIPPSECRCSRLRNDRVKQLELKKKIWNHKETIKDPTQGMPVIFKDNYYFEDVHTSCKQPRFEKLCQEEIDQICEFKDYYLGVEAIPVFDRYLKHKKNSTLDSKTQFKPASRAESTKYHSLHSTAPFLSKIKAINPRECFQKQQSKRANAKSNHEFLVERATRKGVQRSENKDNQLLKAKLTKEECIRKYLQHLQENEAKFQVERAKVVEKKKQDMEDNEILDMESKLRRICSFRPGGRQF